MLFVLHGEGLSERLWNVQYRTHNKILAILSNNLPLEMNLDKHFIKFSNNLLNHSSGNIMSVTSLSLHNPLSNVNRITIMCAKWSKYECK